jgi:iron complex transport system substrate-binding protein
MLRIFSIVTAAALCCTLALSCTNTATQTDNNTTQADTTALRIVSLSGSVTETLVAMGLDASIVGTDVTSTYPESIKSKPKVGSTHNLNVEALLALNPTYVISMKERGLKPEQVTQLQQAGIKVWVIDQEYTIEGTKKYISQIGDTFKQQAKAQELVAKIDADYKALPTYNTKPNVMFIYARGAGALSVCGKNLPMAHMIELAGGTNAGDAFEGFKPLTTEALVKTNPDAILLFNSGMASLDGAEGMLKVPGIAETKAGKNNHFIVMDGELLSGFGPRIISAIGELGEKIHATK